MTVLEKAGLSKRIGFLIRIIRTHQRIPQKKLATDLGITQGQLSNLELGKSDISISRLQEIADLLGFKASELVVLAEQQSELPEIDFLLLVVQKTNKEKSSHAP
jgi:transcriptional regulator with XRE-family HTH domain